MTLTSDQLHGMARVQVSLGRMDGATFDKRQLRFNDIVFTAERYGDTEALRRAGLSDAIDACVIGDPMHVPGGSVRDIVYDWMVSQ